MHDGLCFCFFIMADKHRIQSFMKRCLVISEPTYCAAACSEVISGFGLFQINPYEHLSNPHQPSHSAPACLLMHLSLSTGNTTDINDNR